MHTICAILVAAIALLVGGGNGSAYAEGSHAEGSHHEGSHPEGSHMEGNYTYDTAVAGELAAAPQRAAQEGEQTIAGEVVDVNCYLSHGDSGLGAGHASCARQCIYGGLPVAIKSGGTLYLAVGGDHQTANQLLGGYAGEPVRVTGKVMSRDGLRLIEVRDIQPY